MTVKIGPRRGKFRLGLNQRERRIADEYIAKGYTVLDSGWPDLLCISSDGKAEFVEVKSETDPLRPAQQKMHEGLKKAGIEVKVLRVSGQVLPTPPGEEDCPNTAEGTQTGRPPSPGSNTGMVVFRLSQEEAARLRRAAQERGTTMSEVVRSCVKDAVEEMKALGLSLDGWVRMRMQGAALTAEDIAATREELGL